MTEPDNLVLQLLRDMRASMATKDDLSGLRAEMHEVRDDLRSEMHSLRADVASDLMTTRKELSDRIDGLSDQVAALRRAVVEYHSAVIGHGVLISELEARVRRIEQRLEIPPIDPH